MAKTVLIDRAKVLEADGGCCHYCKHPLTLRTMQVDHIIPVSKGGTSDPSNLAAACPSCNSQKGNKALGEWQQQAQWVSAQGFSDALANWQAQQPSPAAPAELVEMSYEIEEDMPDDEFDTILANRIFRDIQKRRGITV